MSLSTHYRPCLARRLVVANPSYHLLLDLELGEGADRQTTVKAMTMTLETRKGK